MFSLFCGASKSRRKKKNSFSEYSSSSGSSCYHSALDSYGQAISNSALSGHLALSGRQQSITDVNENRVIRTESNLSNFYSDECGSSSNLSVIERINKLTNPRPKSMMSSTKTLYASDEKCPLKRSHSVRFKTEKRLSFIEDERDEGSTMNIFEKLLLIGETRDTPETKCKLRRTRSGVSTRSTRRNFGSTTNLSAVEKLSVSSGHGIKNQLTNLHMSLDGFLNLLLLIVLTNGSNQNTSPLRKKNTLPFW